MSPAYSSLPERVAAIMPIILDHEQKTGKKVMYAFNISGDDPEQMLRDHDIVAEAGGNAAVICINAVGFGGLKFLRKRSRLALHAHRAGWDILTRHPGLGMDFSVYQQFWRLLGIDQFQINGIRVKYWEPDESFVRSFEAVTTPLFSPADCALPVVGSGQWGGQAPDTYRPHGPDHRSPLSLRRRHRQPSGRTRRRGPGGAPEPGRPRWPAFRSTSTRASTASSRSRSKSSARRTRRPELPDRPCPRSSS